MVDAKLDSVSPMHHQVCTWCCRGIARIKRLRYGRDRDRQIELIGIGR